MRNQELNELSRALSKFCVGSEGNASMRTPQGFIIKASGKSLVDNDFVECNTEGVPKSGKASMEVSFHSYIYKNSGYRFIAHTHPTNVLKILCGPDNKIRVFAQERLFPDHVVFNLRTLVIPYETPGRDLTARIAEITADRIPDLLLLKNHGIIVCGNSAREVITATEICDKAAEIFLGTPNPNFLSHEQVAAIFNHADEVYRKALK